MQDLRTEIVERFGSIHKFCRLHQDLNRSTVYQVLSGKYGGDTSRQEKRIRNAIDKNDEEKQIMLVIKQAACCRCSVTTQCGRCDDLFRSQAKAVVDLFSS